MRRMLCSNIAGADEQQRRKRDLRDDEHLADRHAARTIVRGAAAALRAQRGHKLDTRRAQRGNETEQNRREQCEGDRVAHHMRVGMDVERNRLRTTTRDSEEKAASPPRDEKAKASSQHSQHRTLREQLLNETSATGSERQPNAHLAPASRGTRQHEIRHVGADDQQHQPDRGEQNEQRARVRASIV